MFWNKPHALHNELTEDSEGPGLSFPTMMLQINSPKSHSMGPFLNRKLKQVNIYAFYAFFSHNILWFETFRKKEEIYDINLVLPPLASKLQRLELRLLKTFNLRLHISMLS